MEIFPNDFQRIRVKDALKKKIANASSSLTYKHIASVFTSFHTQFQLELLRNEHYPLDFDTHLEPTEEEKPWVEIRQCTLSQVRTYLKHNPQIYEDLNNLRRETSFIEKKQNKRRSEGESKTSDDDDDDFKNFSSEISSLADQNQEEESSSPANAENNHSSGQSQNLVLNNMFNHLRQESMILKTENLLESIGMVTICNSFKKKSGLNIRIV